MLWPPWETVPECSPQIQAWDYLGGYYIRCRGNFRDSELSEPLGFDWDPDYLLATAYVEFIYTLRRQIAQVPLVFSSRSRPDLCKLCGKKLLATESAESKRRSQVGRFVTPPSPTHMLAPRPC